MKNRLTSFYRCLLIGILLLTSVPARSQSSTEGFVDTYFSENSIIRNFRGELVVYGEKPSGEACMMCISNPSISTNIPSIELPRDLHILDFTSYDDTIYFVGFKTRQQDSIAIAGKLPFSDFFQATSHWEIIELNPIITSNITQSTNYKPTLLSRLVTYSDGRDVHIVAVGEIPSFSLQGSTIVREQHYGLYDIVFGPATYELSVSDDLIPIDIELDSWYIPFHKAMTTHESYTIPVSDLSCVK